jgi:hypothetical protein
VTDQTTPSDAPPAYVIIPPGGEVPDPTQAVSEEDRAAAESEAIERPAKVMRIGSMIKQLLDELHVSEMDPPSRARLKEVYELSVKELSGTLSPDLSDELGRLAFPFASDEPTDAELRVAQAQLVGWLEGLFHGIQATLFAQQVAAQAQIEQMRRRGLPVGEQPPGDERPRPGSGNYL